MNSLFDEAKRCLDACEPADKAHLTHSVAAQWRAGALALESAVQPQPFGPAGQPSQLRYVHATAVSKRGAGTQEGRAALIHAIAHIEFTAINLAWDAVYRFRNLPRAYYDDWVQVADEEARHFQMLQARLQHLGHDYGDFPAHGGLWDMAGRTAHDVLERMALVPRVFEARGLDATPGMIARLRSAGDGATADILEIIWREEVGHVGCGTRWFHYCCAQRGVDPQSTFCELLQRYMKGRLRGPFHYDSRRRAGFSDAELEMLEALSVAP